MNGLLNPPLDRPAVALRGDGAPYALLCTLLAADAAGVLVKVPGASHAADVAAIAVALLAMVALGWIAVRRGAAGGTLAFGIGAATGLLFFARTLGLALADPTAIDWLMLQDWAQHYSGWAMFRHTPWAWPPGKMPEVWYPVGTSIAFTDSLPLVALALKPFSAWLPEPFQYIGLWMLASFTLQGGVGALVVTRFSTKPTIVLAGAALFVFAPVLLYRIGHDTLTAHWLLLAALLLYFRSAPSKGFVAEAWPWWLLATVAALVHPYLTAMFLAVEAAALVKRTRFDRAYPLRTAAAIFGVSAALALVAWWLAGALSIRMADSSGGVPFGRYSMNLLAFVDPMYLSSLLPTEKVLQGQSEGFAYLGAGMLALLAVVAVNLVRERRVCGVGRDWLPLLAVAAALLAFATGCVLAIGPWQIAGTEFPSRLLGAFRASGRFVWIAYYVLMLIAIAHVARRFGPMLASTLLTAALIVQMVDLSAAHERSAQKRLKANVPTAGTALEDPRWDALAAGRRHLTLLPPPACGVEAAPYLPMQLFAARHGLTFNSGFVARWNQRKTAEYCKVLGRQLADGAWTSDDLYVVGAAWKARFDASARGARCETLDGYEACVIDAPPSAGGIASRIAR